MPPTKARARQSAADLEISNTNSTVNQFLGGKRKSWMLDPADASVTTPAASPRQTSRTSPKRVLTDSISHRYALALAIPERSHAQLLTITCRNARTTPSTATTAGTLPSPGLTDEPSPNTMDSNKNKKTAPNTTRPSNTNAGPSVSTAAAVDQARAAAYGQGPSPQPHYQPSMAASINNYVHSRPNSQNQQTSNKRRKIT